MKLVRPALWGSPAVRVLGDTELPAALAVCAQDPVAAVLAATRIEASIADPVQRGTGQVWGFPASGPLEAVCWSGANLAPVVPVPTSEILDAFAHQARREGRRCSAIVGPADVALGLWRRLEHAWPPAREIRPEQPSLQIVGDPLVEADATVRHATLDDFDDLLPACAAMFEEEVGYSPITYSGRAYAQRVRSLVEDRRAYIARASGGTGEIVFKAELGAVTRAVAQVQGVWVNPRHRGQGRSAPGMAAVVLAARRDVAPIVSLYANSYNTRALATYRRVGFEQVGTFATVLF